MFNISYNKVFEANNATDAWEFWMELLAPKKAELSADVQLSRDGDVVGEIINATTILIDPTKAIINSPLRKLNMRYMVGELLWYISGNNKLSAIQNITGAWDRMSDDGITVNSNYGHKIKYFFGFDQWEHVKTLLTKDPNTRQAVIHIKNPSNEVTKDTPCTISLQFFIRDVDGVPKLHLTTYMRSNDIWMGFAYDVFQFTCMQTLMAMQLGVKLGTYTHIAGSLHLYDRDYEQYMRNISEVNCNGAVQKGSDKGVRK